MKELSIEEKAKRYDEALKVLHKYDGANIMFSQSLKEEMFPELKESAYNDVMREMAIRAVHAPEAIYCIKSFGIEPDDVIAWLEKQGKNNMGISESTKQKLEDNLNKALEKETQKSWNDFLEKQGEQKPAWSEEDKEMLNQVIEDIVKLAGPYVCYHKDVDWLKSLKGRVQPQPKQEWSEEDAIILNGCINYFKKILDKENNADLRACFRKNINWLKSLRPQSHWKPSDEQMQHLSEVVHEAKYKNDISVGGCSAYMPLASLYLDLKKLKG